MSPAEAKRRVLERFPRAIVHKFPSGMVQIFDGYDYTPLGDIQRNATSAWLNAAKRIKENP